MGSPLEADESTLVKVAKKLKKEKVNVDIVSFGEDEVNADALKKFIETVNGKDGTGSHLVTIPPGPHLSDALISSPIVQVKTLCLGVHCIQMQVFIGYVTDVGMKLNATYVTRRERTAPART